MIQYSRQVSFSPPLVFYLSALTESRKKAKTWPKVVVTIAISFCRRKRGLYFDDSTRGQNKSVCKQDYGEHVELSGYSTNCWYNMNWKDLCRKIRASFDRIQAITVILTSNEIVFAPISIQELVHAENAKFVYGRYFLEITKTYRDDSGEHCRSSWIQTWKFLRWARRSSTARLGDGCR